MRQKFVFLAFLLSLSFSANAGFILNNTTSVSVLNLTEDVDSFYGYTSGYSTTGLELEDTLVFFIAEESGSYYLFGLFDIFGGTNRGKFDLTLTDNSIAPGSFYFVDDSSEVVNQTGNTYGITFTWAAGYSDGIIYELGSEFNNNISIAINPRQNISQVSFLDFSTGLINQTNNFTITSTSAPVSSVAVSTPGIHVILILSILLLTRRKV